MWNVIKALLGSKKFVAALAGVAAMLAGKLGLKIDEDQMLMIISPLLVYIAAQGAADAGKAKLAAPKPPAPPPA